MIEKEIIKIIEEELETVLNEKAKQKRFKKDACYYKVRSKFSVWPSKHATRELLKCRRLGAKNWKRGKNHE